jgi:hypothetical protein
MASLARCCFGHRYLVIFGWIVGLLVLGGLNRADDDAYTIVWRVDAGSVTDQPVRSALAVAVVAALAIPLLWLRLGASDQGNDPRSWTTRKAYDLLAEGFGPGFNGPLLLVAQTPGGQGDRAALHSLAGKVRATGGVASVSPALYNQDGSVAVLQVIPTSAPQDKATSRLIGRLRREVVPQATRGSDLTPDYDPDPWSRDRTSPASSWAVSFETRDTYPPERIVARLDGASAVAGGFLGTGGGRPRHVGAGPIDGDGSRGCGGRRQRRERAPPHATSPLGSSGSCGW